MSLARYLPFVLLAGAGCFGGNTPDDPGQTPPGDDDGPTMVPPVTDPPPPAPATYKRGSLSPVYQLTPREEYNKFLEGGVAMQDGDFTSNANNFISVAQKMDQVGSQIGKERGGATLDLMTANRGDDRLRSQLIPFRGKPSDVDLFIDQAKGIRKAYLPLGGQLGAVGNEIASVDLTVNPPRVTRITVGVHPQRIAIHPAGLIFVCNQFSNYISVIDPTTDRPLQNAAGPIEIKTEFYCSDLAFVPRSVGAQDVDEQDLYVANNWRGSVLKYGLTVTRSGVSNQPTDVRVTNPANPVPESQPAAEITGVGTNPYRLAVSQDLRSIFVANNRGGDVGKIDLASGNARRVTFKAPIPDVAQANDILLLATTTTDRGEPFRDEPRSPLIDAAPAVVTGLDGASHVAHPGAIYDGTRASNFEDMRNGAFTADVQLTTGSAPVYYTDDISAEPNFLAQQKILQGALPQAIAVNKAKTRAYFAMQGSDIVQRVSVNAGGAFRLADGAQQFQTDHRPFALALDEANSELLVADWGGDVLEIFDLNNATRKQRVDLGYATAPYPATNIEKGEFIFYNASWSNNGRKSCATCHLDELSVDGFSWANGAAAPTAEHKIPGNWNLMTTDSYFWTGSFANGTYTSLAADFQTRTNCELILFGLTEGISSDPATRVGDPTNRVRSAQDVNCRPQSIAGKILPQNFDAIAQIIAADHLVRDQVVGQALAGIGVRDFATASRIMDFYSVSDARLPPNPLTYLAANNQLDSKTAAQITQGKTVFVNAGCANCHDPNNTRHPYTDGKNHGAGVGWLEQFINLYQADQRVVGLTGGSLPTQLLDARSGGTPDREINIHLDPIDFFTPFCFDLQKNACLTFDDPIAARGNNALESDRLEALTKVNLQNADRGFIPGNVRGQPLSNTPSLRGVWFQTNFLRHGHAHSFKEAVLAPGHPLLGPGENGFAVDALGHFDVHGTTSKMSESDFEALRVFVESIE
jgi:DNA-binding beta-propeller fold protein YncE